MIVNIIYIYIKTSLSTYSSNLEKEPTPYLEQDLKLLHNLFSKTTSNLVGDQGTRDLVVILNKEHPIK